MRERSPGGIEMAWKFERKVPGEAMFVFRLLTEGKINGIVRKRWKSRDSQLAMSLIAQAGVFGIER